MSKWRERISKILDTEHDRVQAKLNEAEGNYHDTGYQRYYTQMEKLRDELDDIETYQHSSLAIARAESETRRYRNAIATFERQAADYKLYHQSIERPIEETVDALMAKLDMALSERRISS